MKQPRPQGAFPWLWRWGAPIPKPGESALETRLPMKVIFNTIFLSLFFARHPHQNCAQVSHAMAQLFRWNQKVRRYLVPFSYPDDSKLNSSWHTYTNPRPGQYLNHAQSHITRALADTCLDPVASLLGIIKTWNISKSTATNQSSWFSHLTNEPQILAPRIGSIQF